MAEPIRNMLNTQAPAMRRKTDPRPVIVTPRHSPFGGQVLERAAFVRMLYLERKRSERTGRPFVLMLLETGRLLKSGVDRKLAGELLITVADITRETDIKGWYEDGNLFGVIFTEIDPTQAKVVTAALLSRINNAIVSALTIEEINEIRLSFHIFPDGSGTDGSGQGSDSALYPELDQDGTESSRALKRSMDIAGSLCALLCCAPLCIAIAIAIKLTSKGPVFFRQPRVGQFGKQFTFLKFRSMYTACNQAIHQEYVTSLIKEQGAPERTVFKLTGDPRITPLGRFLRKTSLDELPQFINVLKGEMSLVGPRPAIPYEVEQYHTWQRERVLAVKPGITGLWQVGGRSRMRFSDMVRLDLLYARSWTPWLDIKILLKTPRAVLSGDGAY